MGLARCEGDLSALQGGWARAREALLRHPVDLYVLLPLGELAVAAARLGEQWWIEPHLRQAEVVLERLAQPVLWRVPLHWYGVHAAIAGECPQEARRHVSALAEAATASPYAAVLAGAAACWMRVLAGTADIDAVVATARQLAAAGLGAEGARLAGQAAIRTTDRKTMTTLLECARAVPSPAAGYVTGKMIEIDGGAEAPGVPDDADLRPANKSVERCAATSVNRPGMVSAYDAHTIVPPAGQVTGWRRPRTRGPCTV